MSAPFPSARPTGVTYVRYRVVLFALLLAAITYLDRACISTLAPFIMKDLQLTKDQMSWVYSAFAIAYAAFEIPTAWWADRLGTRRVMTRIVLWWSAFTVLSGAAWSYTSLLTLRFLFGAGEAGAWPGAARTFSRWIPRSERGTIQGVFFSAAHLSGGVTPILVLALVDWVSWRTVFVLFGLLGVAWALAWSFWFRDEPVDHPAVGTLELERIVAEREPGGAHHEGWHYWRRLLGHRNTLPICLMYFPNSFAFYFCITWLPTYLQEHHGLKELELGFFTGLPLILSVAGDLFGGLATDLLTRRFGLRIGRAGVGCVAYVVAGAAMIGAAKATQPFLAAWLIGVAVAASMFILGAAWSTCLDIGGSHAAVVSAAMNTSGQVGSVLSPLMVTYLLGTVGTSTAPAWIEYLFGSGAAWNAPLLVMGALFLMGAISWLVIDPRDKVFD